MEYSISHVFDPNTGEVFEAAVVFQDPQLATQFRRRFHESGQILKCVCCEQRATIGILDDTIFFKHFPRTGDCIQKSKEYSIIEREQIARFYASKESHRHKQLKKAIGDYLLHTYAVDPESLHVDSKFLSDQHEKRRPDVLCRYEDRQLAFEIQLSPLPPKFTFKRHAFYQRNGISLIWILDYINVHNPSQTVKDIRNLSEHQNFFYFNDLEDHETFVVEYQQGDLNALDEPIYRWIKVPISLAEFKFDVEGQPYYVSFQQEQLETELPAFKVRHQETLDLLRSFYIDDNAMIIPSIDKALSKLTGDDYKFLKIVMRLNPEGDLLQRSLNGGKHQFIQYLFGRSALAVNPNKDGMAGRSFLQTILVSKQLKERWKLIQLGFARQYEITEADRDFLKNFTFHQAIETERVKSLIKLFAFNIFKDQELIDLYPEIEGPILVILSAQFRRIIGYQFNDFASLAHTAIRYKSTYHFMELAFQYYGVWETILAEDKNKAFEFKRNVFLTTNNQIQNENALAVLQFLFPAVVDLKHKADWIQYEWLGLS